MKTPFKLKSGNKPSMAQLSGVSPVKNKFQEARKAMRERAKAKRAERKEKRAERKSLGEPSKIKQNITNVFSRVDKAIQGFFNNPRGQQRIGENKYVPYKKADKK